MEKLICHRGCSSAVRELFPNATSLLWVLVISWVVRSKLTLLLGFRPQIWPMRCGEVHMILSLWRRWLSVPVGVDTRCNRRRGNSRSRHVPLLKLTDTSYNSRRRRPTGTADTHGPPYPPILSPLSPHPPFPPSPLSRPSCPPSCPPYPPVLSPLSPHPIPLIPHCVPLK